MTARAAVSRERRAMLAKVHVAAKDLGLAEASYRDLLERVTGKRSAADCNDAELDRVLAEFARLGWTPKRKGRRARKQPAPAVRPRVAKMRALWRALYNLGEVVAPGDAALAAFVKRQTGIEAMAWMTSGAAYKVIEALKAWCARAGFDVPQGGIEAKRALLGAQWCRWAELDATRAPGPEFLDAWLTGKVSPRRTRVSELSAWQCDNAADMLGQCIRHAKKEDGD